jgi:hypothetical protein
MTRMGWEHREAKLPVPGCPSRRELLGPMAPATIDDHHDLFPGVTASCHHLVHILAQLLNVNMRHDFREGFGGAILHRPKDSEQHAAGDPTPRAILCQLSPN